LTAAGRPGFAAPDAMLVLLLFVVITIYAGATQRTERLYADAQKYHAMSVQFYEGRRPIVEEGPFVFRIGTPWLASAVRPWVERTFPRWHRAVDDMAGMVGVSPFLVLNVVAGLGAALLLLAYVSRLVTTGWIPILLVGTWMATWLEPVRFVFFYPATVDVLFLVCLFAAFLVVETTRTWRPLAGAIVLTPVAFLGALVRESMVLAPLAFAVAAFTRREELWRDRLTASLLPFAAWAAGMAVARSMAVAAPPYHPLAEPFSMAAQKPVFTWALAWFTTFGPPVIALILAGGTEVAALLRRRPELGLHLTACGVLAFFGGTDTERILTWAAPAVYVLAGAAMDARRAALLRMPALVVVLAVIQLASCRLLWPIPVGIDHVQRFGDLSLSLASIPAVADKFLVIHNYYSNLWSFFGSRTIHAITLAFDVVITGAASYAIARRSGAVKSSIGRATQ
jgi:hypothetical protein